MYLKKVAGFVVGLLIITSVSATPQSNPLSKAECVAREAINRDRVVNFDVRCLSFSGKEKILPIKVIDVVKNDVEEIFQKLFEKKFPIYALSCYSPRTIRGSNERVSLHAYAAAIDLNYLMNPHYDVITGNMIPTRKANREEDKRTIVKELKSINTPNEEIESILDVVIENQPEDSDDRFLNRGIIRKGMITPEIVNIFKIHGFNIWGGNWRRPMDYMHFQIPLLLAKKLADDEKDFDSRKKIWEEHKEKIKE